MTTNPDFSVPRHQYGDGWRVDDQGYLHTGTAAALTERVVVSCTEGRR